uniref:hypothetical protein n=1 Tax=Thaumasiovibrio occultus TaxID=1891184 RepID=UPI000B351275|nr:hypothetical protein [Thaumasiovibrio occultus]
MKFKLLVLSSLLVLSGCSQRSLVGDTYGYTLSDDQTEQSTAFIVLSNVALPDAVLAELRRDYANETDPAVRIYYEYTLFKRTQEREYLASYLQSARIYPELLLSSHSDWVTSSNPPLDLLLTASYSHDDALAQALTLGLESDGFYRSSIGASLSRLHFMNAARVVRVANENGISDAQLHDLLVDE